MTPTWSKLALKPPQHLVWVGGWGLVWRTRRARAVASTSATGMLAYRLGRRGSAFGGLLMVTAFLGDCRMPAAVLLVAQAGKSGVALLASQSPVIDPDKEEAAAEPYEDGSGGRLISLGSPSPLIDVLALNVGKDCVQRTSEKVACRLDACSCGIEKVGRRYLVGHIS